MSQTRHEHKDLADAVRVELEGGWFMYVEYPTSLFVVHLEAEKGKGNAVLRSVKALAREKGKQLWGTVSPHGEMSAERLLRWYKRVINAEVMGKYHGHDLIRSRI